MTQEQSERLIQLLGLLVSQVGIIATIMGTKAASEITNGDKQESLRIIQLNAEQTAEAIAAIAGWKPTE